MTEFESWAKKSFEIAAKIAYLNGKLIGTPRDGKEGLPDGRGGSRAACGIRASCRPDC